ncbi:chromatin remodeling protein [Encephalitozoon intestinalis ATCC 50506]|uniref:Chromatin remodeling protein n=1 Tax=Encephalitozoon intestinalis (strain ATCC 50506) TaxID=876142 RepID=E0S9P4_ENCIT|nr:chromatin remodeling protein [Encephalitozoon intestinalis ATCC 50506]ADM12429.1 chromatin remodeling protein [Encephalitozoon intestinalis ATCC 50506]UTX46264.1 hypothetical protein GPK93_10g18630 [Encephalitozoon intestinalis]
MQTHFEVFDKMLEEIQQLRLDAIYFTKSTSRTEGKIEKLRGKCKRYKEKFVRKPSERYFKKIEKFYRAIKKHLVNNRRCEDAFQEVIHELKKKCEDLCSRSGVSFDLECPEIPDVNCVVNLGEMGSNEQLYCKCKRPAFKNMIACDSLDCKGRWFHFECVGISTVPKTLWICPECRKAGTLTR